jgi:putative hydrolases of HD superfamily
MTDSLSNLLDFVSFTHDIRRIKRSMWVRDEEQYENDSEHGYQLALTSLYVIEENKLKIDPFRTMGLAIVHDILEVHAGDTPVFGTAEAIKSKRKREAEAVQALRQQWPNAPLMHQLIDEYESLGTAESKFVYALDKLLPTINNYLDNGRNWKHDGVKLENIRAVKAGKVDIDPVVKKYYEAIIKVLHTKPELFGG